MKSVNLVAKIISLIILFTCSIFPQSIWFDYLRDNQVRSDFYSPELVYIPTGHNFSVSTPLVTNWYVRLIVWDGNNNEIGNYSSRGDDVIPDLKVGPGVYTLKLILYELDLGATNFVERADCQVRIEEKYLLNVWNNVSGGQVYIDNQLTYSGAGCMKGLDEQLTVSVDDIAGADYYYAWKESGTNKSCWKIRYSGGTVSMNLPSGESRTYMYHVKYGDNRAIIHSDLRRVCNITIANNFSGCINKGSILIDDIPKSSPYKTTILSGEQVKATAVDYEDNGIHYVFSHWEDNSTSPTRYISVNSNSNYTAYYKGTPVYTAVARNLEIQNDVRAHPVLTWRPHPNPLITSYKIYRRVLKGPNTDPGSLINEVPSSTHTYTDFDYYNIGTQYQDIIFYDVDAFCASEQTSSEQYWQGLVFGILVKQKDSLYAEQTKKELNTENSLSSYPNPFNPATQIRYSIKEGGLVSLQVYDILGNKVADLVNEYKPAGTHVINFDAADKPTGIYICSIKANNYTETKKLLLIK